MGRGRGSQSGTPRMPSELGGPGQLQCMGYVRQRRGRHGDIQQGQKLVGVIDGGDLCAGRPGSLAKSPQQRLTHRSLQALDLATLFAVRFAPLFAARFGFLHHHVQHGSHRMHLLEPF